MILVSIILKLLFLSTLNNFIYLFLNVFSAILSKNPLTLKSNNRIIITNLYLSLNFSIIDYNHLNILKFETLFLNDK